ncbi:MAG TPA: hypothetical protein VEY92_06550 [Pseudoxanthomonas sp.]|nr:hypothetical protein [Pseudoxanthomonas sp.]
MIGLHTLYRRAARVLPAALQTCEVLPPPLSQRELVSLVLPLRHRHSGTIGFPTQPRHRAGDARVLARVVR